jgi:hypothetical protein
VIRRALGLAPALLLTGGCVNRAWTPSDRMITAAQTDPPLHHVELPAQGDAVARWQLPPSSAWARYEKLTLLTSLDQASRPAAVPDVEELASVQSARAAARALAATTLPARTLWVVDLRGAASVAFGSTLSQLSRSAVAAIPTFNNWPAEVELVPAEETLAALVAMTPRLPAGDEHAHPVFLLDAWRLAYRDEEVGDDVTDNRYMLGPADFPDTAVLRSEGIARVVYVVESLADKTREEDDMHATLLGYQRAGVDVAIVDLDWLAAVPREADLEDRLAARVYAIEPRETVVFDSAFYVRARGGFGGFHGVPFRGGGGGGFVGGSGGWRGGG